MFYDDDGDSGDAGDDAGVADDEDDENLIRRPIVDHTGHLTTVLRVKEHSLKNQRWFTEVRGHQQGREGMAASLIWPLFIKNIIRPLERLKRWEKWLQAQPTVGV